MSELSTTTSQYQSDSKGEKNGLENQNPIGSQCCINNKSQNSKDDHIIDQTDSALLVLSNFGNQTNLQENFKKFRKERNEKFKYQQSLKNKKLNDRFTQDFQDQLRKKFVDTAMKYLGTPYAKKYLKPDNPNYHSPIFLDCCGLVRQVVADLKEDFGFKLGGWNQGYQFDTLPIKMKLEDMKPGDLVFYSGTYYNTGKRKQKHDMVHVEIYLGGPTGEQTIGARWNNGVVSIFDSYKFVSKTYYDIKFHFVSIDTWLQGVCKSFCDEHPWLEDRDFFTADRLSVFANQDAEEEGNGPVEETGSTLETEEKKEDTTSKKVKNFNRVFVGKGNNDKLVKGYFTNQKYTLLDQKMAFSDKFDLKWVQTTAEVDYKKFKEGEQIVNHIPNIINVLGSKNGLIQTLLTYEEHNPDYKGPKVENFMPNTFRLDVLTDEIEFVKAANEGYWITKPYHTNQGKNLKIITDIKGFKRDFLRTKLLTLGQTVFDDVFGSEVRKEFALEEEKEAEFEKVDTRVVIQKYIENPLLLNNKKFDIRCYLLIGAMKPMFVLFANGYCRLCLDDYSLGINEKGSFDKLAHLTNNSVQKRHQNYSAMKENSIWKMDKFEAYLRETKSTSEEQIQTLYSEIKAILAHCAQAAEATLDKKTGYFQLLGCDILVDENLKPYLLEINSNPAIFTDITAHKEVIPDVVFKTLDLVISLNQKNEQLQELLAEPEKLDLGMFEVLVNGQTNFVYGTK